jgi:very-short-patch-repair endonuclease
MLGYIVDFYCPAERLAIELDGSAHHGREEYDRKRDADLAAYGVRVLRFPNFRVMAHPDRFRAEVMAAFAAAHSIG